MIEGVLRHDSGRRSKPNYVGTHGASIVGFAFTELLGFKLLPGLRNFGSIRASNEGRTGGDFPVLKTVRSNAASRGSDRGEPWNPG